MGKIEYLRLLEEFKQKWPLEKIQKMTLEEYTSSSKDCFIYWVEVKMSKLGSIWGGSAFKFGIFARSNNIKTENKSGRSYSDKYAWLTKYGNNEDEVFLKIRGIICDIIKAAHENKPEEIDRIDLGDLYKWKLVSLYQNPNFILSIYVFSKDALISSLAIDDSKPTSLLYKELIKNKPDNLDLLDYSNQIWNSYVIKNAIWKVAHFNSDFNDEDLANMIKEKRFLLNLEKRDVQDSFNQINIGQYFYLCHNHKIILLGKTTSKPERLKDRNWIMVKYEVIKFNEDDRDYSGSKKRWSPLSKTTIKLITLNELRGFNELITKPIFDFNILSEIKVNFNNKRSNEIPYFNNTPGFPKNLILYGPPGTGKTYSSITYAVAIIENLQPNILEHKYSRIEILEKFYNYKELGLINFITFHQSYSYEDFIEGIKPKTTLDKQLTYIIEDGLLKSIVHKIKGFSFLIKGDKYNYSKGKELTILRVNDFLIEVQKEDGQIIFIPTAFLKEVLEKVNNKIITYEDLKIRKKDNKHIQEFFDVKYDKYLFGYESIIIKLVKLINNKINNINNKFVLIIDEINRGNIASIFGELITLIEEDKREGESNKIDALLPYSKELFSIPNNLFFIGTMNTADRSVEALDTALRRRFSFIEIEPNTTILNKPEFRCKNIDIHKILETINDNIERLLDKDYRIGHSYFMNIKNKDNPLKELKDIFSNKIIPLLQEYFYNDWGKILLILGKEFIQINNNFKFKGNDFEDTEIISKPTYKVTDPSEWTLESFRTIYE